MKRAYFNRDEVLNPILNFAPTFGCTSPNYPLASRVSSHAVKLKQNYLPMGDEDVRFLNKS